MTEDMGPLDIIGACAGVQGTDDPRGVVADWLRSHGYDGLHLADCGEGCGCSTDDLMPCAANTLESIAESCPECRPGYEYDCRRCSRRGTYGCPVEDDLDCVFAGRGFCEPDYGGSDGRDRMDTTVYVVVRDVVNSLTGGLLESAPVRSFRDWGDAECELQRLEDGERGVYRQYGQLVTRDDFRIEEVELA